MQRRQGSFKARDQIEICYQVWLPDGAPKAALQIVHGLGEHAGRYENYADYFVPRGYALYAADLRGHGRSGGPRGHAPSYESLMHDIGLFHARVREEQTERKIALVGHSLGGNLALNYALRRGDGLAAVVVTGPWLMLPQAPPAPLVALARLLSRIAPSYTQANRLDVSGISRDPAVVATYAENPLVHDRITARLYVECAAAAAWALEHAGDLSPPTFVLHGGADRLTSPRGSRRFWENAGKPHIEHREYAGMYHELHNDLGKEIVFKDVEDWLATKL
jgi:alpha-beta hydrolase superfamily lysophospholipase